jgi:imidazolonepropionase
MSTTVFVNASEILDGTAVHQKCALAITDGLVAALGPQDRVLAEFADAERVDSSSRVLTPGFVDSHTHAVFGEWRAAEYEMRSQGLDYMEIARRGGGINASVKSVRELPEDALLEMALSRLHLALRHGTTTIEIKSGYGLSVRDELKLLHVIRRLAEYTVLDIVPTFLGAHDVPLDYRDRRADYVRLIVEEMIPQVAQEELAVFCDVFMEPGAFNAAETRTILEAGSRCGLIPKLHADEFENSGAAELAVELGAASADHLGAISEQGIAALAGSATVATLLPATLFFLGKKAYAPARRLIDAGATVALATDFNPGTAPSPSMPLVLTMACSQMQMTPLEAINAATLGGARALRRDRCGTLAPGARGDVVAWNVTTHGEIPYHFGTPPIAAIWKAGNRVV